MIKANFSSFSGGRIRSYLFGFNGKEKLNEQYGEGNAYDFGERIYDPRTSRWLSLDPLQAAYPHLTPYQAFNNSPIIIVDPDGRKLINGHEGGNADYKDRVDAALGQLMAYNIELYQFMNTVRALGDGRFIFIDQSGNYIPIGTFYDDENLNDLYNDQSIAKDIDFTITIEDIDGKEEFKEEANDKFKNSSSDEYQMARKVDMHKYGTSEGVDGTGEMLGVTPSSAVSDGSVEFQTYDKNAKQLVTVNKDNYMNYSNLTFYRYFNAYSIKLDDYMDLSKFYRPNYGEVLAHEGGHLFGEITNMLGAYLMSLSGNGGDGTNHNTGNPSGQGAENEQNIYNSRKNPKEGSYVK